jgi:ribosomal protein S18 acetylase RimI-like enzyme
MGSKQNKDGSDVDSKLTIRRANDGDVDSLVGLCAVVQDLHATAIPDFFKQADRKAYAHWFREMLARTDVTAWVASSNDVIVGYALAAVVSRLETPFSVARSFYQLDQISVSPDCRRKGVARALVERVVDDARARGLHEVELTAWSFNAAAHAAFEALGFRPMVVRFGRDCD